MSLSKTPEEESLDHRRKLSDEQALASYSPVFLSLTSRSATDDKNSNNVVMSPIQNLNSQSPSEKMTPVKKHHRHYHFNRPRSKSESEALHHRSTSIKKGTNSPGGHYYHHVQSPMSVSPSFSKYRSLGKMWIRPVSVNKNQWNQVIEQQQGTSSVSHLPFLPDFGSGKNSHEDGEDAAFYTAFNSSFHAYQRDSELSTAPSNKLAFTFGESGKPIKSSLEKRHSPTSVI